MDIKEEFGYFSSKEEAEFLIGVATAISENILLEKLDNFEITSSTNDGVPYVDVSSSNLQAYFFPLGESDFAEDEDNISYLELSVRSKRDFDSHEPEFRVVQMDVQIHGDLISNEKFQRYSYQNNLYILNRGLTIDFEIFSDNREASQVELFIDSNIKDEPGADQSAGMKYTFNVENYPQLLKRTQLAMGMIPPLIKQFDFRGYDKCTFIANLVHFILLKGQDAVNRQLFEELKLMSQK